MSEYFSLFLNSIESCFSDIVAPLDDFFIFSPLALSLFVFSLIYRFLLSPLMRSAGSDVVKKIKKR